MASVGGSEPNPALLFGCGAPKLGGKAVSGNHRGAGAAPGFEMLGACQSDYYTDRGARRNHLAINACNPETIRELGGGFVVPHEQEKRDLYKTPLLPKISASASESRAPGKGASRAARLGEQSKTRAKQKVECLKWNRRWSPCCGRSMWIPCPHS